MIDAEMAKAITATGAFIGAVAMGFKKAGLITFGKPVERRSCSTEIVKQCSDHKVMRADIEVIKSNSQARLEKLNMIDGKLDGVERQLAQVIGYLQGKNGYHT